MPFHIESHNALNYRIFKFVQRESLTQFSRTQAISATSTTMAIVNV
jgi:hypothetical protein